MAAGFRPLLDELTRESVDAGARSEPATVAALTVTGMSQCDARQWAATGLTLGDVID